MGNWSGCKSCPLRDGRWVQRLSRRQRPEFDTAVRKPLTICTPYKLHNTKNTNKHSPVGKKKKKIYVNMHFHRTPFYTISTGIQSPSWKWILWVVTISRRSQHEWNHERKKGSKKKKNSATASLTFNSPKHPCFTASGYCLSQSVPWDTGVMGPVDWRERDVIPLSPLSRSSASSCPDLWPPCWVTSVSMGHWF